MQKFKKTSLQKGADVNKKVSDEKENITSYIKGRNTFWRILIGLLFLTAAGIVACSTLGIISWEINIFWVTLIALLAVLAIACLFRFQWFGVFIPIAGIASILNVQTDYLPQLEGHIGALWIIAVLVSVGFSILIKNTGMPFYANKKHHSCINGYKKVIDDKDDSNVEVLLSSTIKYINTDDFRHVRLANKLGSMRVYFDNAKIKNKEAVIEFNGSMCDYELYIPHSWRVINEINVTMSDIDEKNTRRHNGKDEKTVRLIGNLTMSDVEIIYM